MLAVHCPFSSFTFKSEGPTTCQRIYRRDQTPNRPSAAGFCQQNLGGYLPTKYTSKSLVRKVENTLDQFLQQSPENTKFEVSYLRDGREVKFADGTSLEAAEFEDKLECKGEVSDPDLVPTVVKDGTTGNCYLSSKNTSGTVVCERPLEAMHCVAQDGLLALLKMAAFGPKETDVKDVSDCIQNCKLAGSDVSIVNRNCANQTVCVCSDIGLSTSELFQASMAHPGLCGPDCDGQMCGTCSGNDQGVAVYVNSLFDSKKYCHSIFLGTTFPQSKEVELQSQSGDLVDVRCEFEQPSVCQAPLMALTGSQWSGDSVLGLRDFAHIQSNQETFQFWVQFEREVMVRAIYTAWNVTSVSYLNQAGQQRVLVRPGTLNEAFAFEPSKKDPVWAMFPEPIITNRVTIEAFGRGRMHSGLLELLGCVVGIDEGMLHVVTVKVYKILVNFLKGFFFEGCGSEITLNN